MYEDFAYIGAELLNYLKINGALNFFLSQMLFCKSRGFIKIVNLSNFAQSNGPKFLTTTREWRLNGGLLLGLNKIVAVSKRSLIVF